MITTKPRDLADVALWIEALDFMIDCDAAGARQVQRDLADPVNQINEYLDAVEQSPPHNCTTFELMWRRRHSKLRQYRGI